MHFQGYLRHLGGGSEPFFRQQISSGSDWLYKLTVFENRQKKVAFNIASEASYVYILNGQKTKKSLILLIFCEKYF